MVTNTSTGPRWVRIYDDGGETFDRYTVVYTRRRAEGLYLGMSERPTNPQGFGQHGGTRHPWERIDAPDGKWPPAVGRRCHLGRRITWAELPDECQRVVLADYRAIWGDDAA